MSTCFILCDTLRADRVNPHIMPEVYDIACNGTIYSMFWGDGGNTKRSMPHYLSGQRKYDLENSFPSILSRHGVKNTIVHSNAVLVEEKYQDCFQHSVDMGMEVAPAKTLIRRTLKQTGIWTKTRNLRREITQNKTFNIPYRRAENILSTAQKELDKLGDGFLWVQLMDPHIPYSPPGLNNVEQLEAQQLYDKLLKTLRGEYTCTAKESQRMAYLYDKECRYMDHHVAEFIHSNPDVLFFIGSDHGDMFGENYTYSHSPGPHGVTPQLGHLPHIVTGPSVPKQRLCDYNCSINVGATVLDLYGVEERCGYGRSYASDLGGKLT